MQKALKGGGEARAVANEIERVPIRVWMAVFVVFSLVCSGGFGIEDMVSGSGPGFTLLLLLFLPFFWSLPQALVCSELGSAMPEEGGLYRWSRRANGEFMGFQTGWWWVISIFIDTAVYIALTADYMQTLFGLNVWTRWATAILLIVIFAYVNVRGIKIASWLLVALQVVVIIPFLVLAVIGLAKWRFNPFDPILLPGISLLGGTGVALSVGIWMYSGFESLSTMAGEIKDPQWIIPRALMITLPVVICFYVLSTMGGLTAVGQFARWGTSGDSPLDFIGVGAEAGGQVLRYLFFASMLAGNFALFGAYLAAGARPSYMLSKDNLLPKIFSKTSKKYGTPWVAILLIAVIDAMLVRWNFTKLIVKEMFLLMLTYITIYVSAIRLRIKEPEMLRPFKVNLGTSAFIAMCIAPVALAVLSVSPWASGWGSFIEGMILALTGLPAYVIFKAIYGGTKKPDDDKDAAGLATG